VACLVLILLFALGTAGAGIGGPGGRLWRWLSLPSALALLGLLAIALQAERTPYTAGANDNATGAGVVLSLADWLAVEPLAHTTVWVLLSGCEEVGCYGADAFARAHADELAAAPGSDTPAWIVLDSVGSSGGRLHYVTEETFLFTARSDPGLIALARDIARRRPELEVTAKTFEAGGYTEGSIGSAHGFRVLTLISLADGGALNEWHRPTDTVENVDPDVVARTEAFVWELLAEIDGTDAVDREALRSRVFDP
jgi:Zn-dependent M28 family amino/carboxypeptidase